MSVPNTAITPVRRSITVKTDAPAAFEVFTNGIDTWWPRSHHIGSAPSEGGDRAESRWPLLWPPIDGTECEWGQVLVWDPPKRLVFAWQITPEWTYQPICSSRAKSKCCFTPLEKAQPA